MVGGGFPRFERHLARDGLALRLVHAWRGDPLPPLEECDAILVGGSPLAAYDWEAHAFLREEAAFIRRAADGNVPLLGICFGAQFLAHLLVEFRAGQRIRYRDADVIGLRSAH